MNKPDLPKELTEEEKQRIQQEFHADMSSKMKNKNQDKKSSTTHA